MRDTRERLPASEGLRPRFTSVSLGFPLFLRRNSFQMANQGKSERQQTLEGLSRKARFLSKGIVLSEGHVRILRGIPLSLDRNDDRNALSRILCRWQTMAKVDDNKLGRVYPPSFERECPLVFSEGRACILQGIPLPLG